MLRPPSYLLLATLPLLTLLGCGDDGAGSGDSADETSTTAADDTGPPTSTTMTSTPTSADDGSTSSEGSSSSDDAEDDDASADTTTGVIPPEVIEVSPLDGATGVTAAAAVVISFSEPMDVVSTQAAYQSSSLPAGGVTFAWNDTHDQLTITPNAPLEYAAASDPDADAPTVYGYTLTTTAASKAGVALTDDVSVSFSTLRAFDQTLAIDDDLSGSVSAAGTKPMQNYLGDHQDNDWNRYFMSFDLSALADDIADVQTAVLTVARAPGVAGAPFTDLGGVAYQQVNYPSLAPLTYAYPGIGVDALILGGLAEQSNTANVKIQLNTALSDPAIYAQRLQFRLFWYPIQCDFMGDADGIFINETATQLRITYLAP